LLVLLVLSTRKGGAEAGLNFIDPSAPSNLPCLALREERIEAIDKAKQAFIRHSSRKGRFPLLLSTSSVVCA